MIVHIVIFKFKDENKAENIAKVKEALLGLVSKIDVLNTLEVGVDFNQSERAFDLSLYSTFDSKDALQTYAIHEEHLKVVSLIKEVTTESKVVDYIQK
jgi:hypothetical protein